MASSVTPGCRRRAAFRGGGPCDRDPRGNLRAATALRCGALLLAVCLLCKPGFTAFTSSSAAQEPRPRSAKRPPRQARLRAAQPFEPPRRRAVQMNSVSMRAIWDAVCLALFGAPAAVPASPPQPTQEGWAPGAGAGAFVAVAPAQEQPAPEALEELVEEIETAFDEAGLVSESHCDLRRSLFSENTGSAEEPHDFFLFIKDYGWSLRYRVCQLSNSVLDAEKPLKLEWVKLRKPIHSPDQLLNIPSLELFDWDVREAPSHDGFMYQVTRAVGSGVEAVINFFKDYGLKLLIQPDAGIQLAGGQDNGKQKRDVDDEPRAVTHCWVQVMGLPFLPILQSIAFFNSAEVVVEWQA